MSITWRQRHEHPSHPVARRRAPHPLLASQRRRGHGHITGLILVVAIVVNLLIPGRVMHWDIVGIIGGGAVVGLALGLRLRLI